MIEQHEQYQKVQCAGFITYCDALIARAIDDTLYAFFLSLIGSPSHIKASSAVLFSGESCRISNDGDPAVNLEFSGNMRTCRSRKIGETVNKVIIGAKYFPGDPGGANIVVIYGPDMPTVQERAFLMLDAGTTIPLKPEWQGWLWDEVLQPEKLYSFGSEELQEAYLVSWSKDDTLQEQVLEGVANGYLT